MLIKLNKIKNFGIYKSFAWQNTIRNFSKFNLIYGWNYSGKTTLSRVFRCLELGRIHRIEPIENAEFEFEDNAGNRLSHDYVPRPSVRVFNSDFILENLKWDVDDKIEPIVLLGEENIALQDALACEKNNLASMEALLPVAIRNKQAEQDRISSAATDKAREVASALQLTNYNRTHLINAIDQLPSDCQHFLLTEQQLRTCQTQATSNEQKPTIQFEIPPISNLSALKTEVNIVLQLQCAAENKIEKLLKDAKLSQWVEQGKVLHFGKDKCEFCGGTIHANVIDALNSHFSQEFEQLKNALQDCFHKVSGAIIVLISHLPSETNFYVDLQVRYKDAKDMLENNIIEFNASLHLLVSDIENKKSVPFDKTNVTEFIDNQAEVESALEYLKEIIQENNKRTVDFEIEKAAAIQKVKKAHAAEFETEKNYSKTIAKIQNDEQAIVVLKKAIVAKKAEIKEIESQLLDTVKGAEQVNDYLSEYFNKDDISIEANSSGQFKLMRGSEPAKNLSEGEKTAIGFAYFMASLAHNGNLLANTIVYLDDPISSLDSNHLYNTYAFIKSHFYRFNLTATEKHECLCLQLFISTHNYDLLNLIKDWFKDTKAIHHSFYTVEKESSGESKIKAMPAAIFQFKSEYVYIYIFSLMYSFKLNPSHDFTHLYNLPNIIRRFIETFSTFKFLSTKKIEESLDHFIQNTIQREKVRKFVHYNSHGLDTTRMLRMPDFSEASDVVTIVMNSLESVDKTHYDALCGSVVSQA